MWQYRQLSRTVSQCVGVGREKERERERENTKAFVPKRQNTPPLLQNNDNHKHYTFFLPLLIIMKMKNTKPKKECRSPSSLLFIRCTLRELCGTGWPKSKADYRASAFALQRVSEGEPKPKKALFWLRDCALLISWHRSKQSLERRFGPAALPL